MRLIMALQLLWWLVVLFALPCESQSDLKLVAFSFDKNDVQFVLGERQRVTIYLEFQINTTDETNTIKLSYNYQLYFDESETSELQLYERKSSDSLIFPSRTNGLSTVVGEESVEFKLSGSSDECMNLTKFCIDVNMIKFNDVLALGNEASLSMCTSVSSTYLTCNQTVEPYDITAEDFFWPMIAAIIVFVIFLICVCFVCYRFRKRIKQSRFWVGSSSPEEAYNVIRKRLNVKSWYDKKPYVVDTSRQAKPTELDLAEVKQDNSEYSHLKRPLEQQIPVLLMGEDGNIQFDKEVGKGGTDNLGYLENGYASTTYAEQHPYEDNLQSVSNSSSSNKIPVIIENERNSAKDSESSRQESSLSTEQSTSAGSYIQALKRPEDRNRSPSIFPVKPDVEIGRKSSGESEPDKAIGSLGFPPLPPAPPPHSDTSGELEEESHKIVESLRVPPPPPPQQYKGNAYDENVPAPPARVTSLPEEVRMLEEVTRDMEKLLESSTEQDQSRSGGKKKPAPPPLRPKPPKKHPEESLRESVESSGSDQNDLPPLIIKQRNRLPSRGFLNITGGGSTKMASDFRRPSLFRTNSSDNLLPPSQQDQKQLPDVLRRTLEANFQPPASSKSNRSSGIWSGTGTMKRSQAEFASAVLENFLAIVEEIEHPQEPDDEEESPANTSSDASIPERPRRVAASRPLSVRRNSTPLLMETEKRMSMLSQISDEGSYMSDVYVNKWNKAWEFDRGDLLVDRGKPLGEGQFGKVYKGVASNIAGRPGDTTVAIKELKDGAASEDKDEFLKELAIHTLMEPHENVIELLGCCIRDEPLCIVMEFMKNGSLLKYLRKQKRNEAQAKSLCARFGYQIAQGMEHVANMGIVHRDLAARNILVSDQLVCKVSDFGFARDVFGVKTYNKAPEKAPIRWYAPEAILDDLFTTKTDVWSFGILLFEIVTMGYVLPYHRDPSTASVRLTIATGGVPPKPPYCDNELYKVMKMCWRREPDDRPEFEELAKIFADLQTHYEPPSPYGESDA